MCVHPSICASEAISVRSKLNKKYHNYNYRTVFVVDCKSWSEKDGCCLDLSGMIVVRYTGSRFSPIRRTSTNTKAHNCSTTSDTNTITNTEAQNYSATVNVEELAPKSLSNNLRLGFLLFQDLTPPCAVRHLAKSSHLSLHWGHLVWSFAGGTFVFCFS